MTLPSGRIRGQRIDPEIKRAVLAAPATISNSDLARQYKITDVTVSVWRRAAGIVGPNAKSNGTAKAAAAKPARVVKPKPARVASVDVGETPAGIPVHLTVSEEILDGWWKRLSCGDKAAIFGGHYVIKLEGCVS